MLKRDGAPPSEEKRVLSSGGQAAGSSPRSGCPSGQGLRAVGNLVETIHPFPDGNGRTGRAYLHAMLRNKDLTRQVTVPISAGLLADIGAYESALTDYRDGNATPIVRCLADASFRAISNARRLAGEITEIRRRWAEQITARSDSRVWDVAKTLTRQPVINSRFVQDQLRISDTAALKALETLQNLGIVTEFSGGKRNRCWRSDEVCAALDAFASRAGRRVS